MSATSRYFYRFRSINALLEGFEELSGQEIYFAPPKELNDALEGFKNILWRGDQIVWTNLLRHYLLCLFQSVMWAIISGEEASGEQEPMFVLSDEGRLPSPQLQGLYAQAARAFLEHHTIAPLPGLLAARGAAVKRNELTLYLRTLQPVALNAVLSAFESAGLIPVRANDDPLRVRSGTLFRFDHLINALKTAEEEHPDTHEIAELLFGVGNSAMDQIALIARYGKDEQPAATLMASALLDFPGRYVEQLEQVLYPDWYAACFVSEPTHSAMWGAYAEGHRGVCLKFKAHRIADDVFGLKLKTMTGLRGTRHHEEPFYSDVVHKFHQVRYVQQFVEIDFFRSIGRLPGPVLMKWYTDAAGAVSPIAEEIFASSEVRRKKYWDAFVDAVTAKSPDWCHEREYRLVLQSMLFDLSPQADRTLKYNFSELQGIIFGAKTSMADKLRIMKIIDAKCAAERRDDFEFLQATYSSSTGALKVVPMGLLKITP